MASCPTETATWKNSMAKNFTVKNFCQMPAMTKFFYNELFSREDFQQ